MKNSKIFILTVLLLINLLGCNSEKSPESRAYSYNIEESKSNGVFQFETNCNKPVFILDSLYKCYIESAWVENTWNKQVMMFGKSKVLKFDSSFQLILKLKTDTLPNKKTTGLNYFIGYELLDNFVHYRCKNNSIDKIKVPLYKQINSENLSDSQKAFDTLSFVKQ